MGATLGLAVVALLVLAVLVWVVVTVFGAVASKEAGTDPVEHRGRQRGSDLLLGASAPVDVGPHPTGAGPFPLHAVRPGSDQAVCGAPVRVQLDETWPGSLETSCDACADVLGRGEADVDAGGPSNR